MKTIPHIEACAECGDPVACVTEDCAADTHCHIECVDFAREVKRSAWSRFRRAVLRRCDYCSKRGYPSLTHRDTDKRLLCGKHAATCK